MGSRKENGEWTMKMDLTKEKMGLEKENGRMDEENGFGKGKWDKGLE